jgi:cullin-associated NEDD8-dissociated protein 1
MAMKETVMKPELVREVQMGPFKHKIDDGLEIRKSAYETLYALLETAFAKLSPVDLADCFDRIVAGICDDHDIRILCNLILMKLIDLAPDQTHSRLESIATQFRTVLSIKPKENAVKQEIEKLQEGSKGVLKVSIILNKKLGADSGAHEDPHIAAWSSYWDWVNKEFPALMRTVQQDLKDRTR